MSRKVELSKVKEHDYDILLQEMVSAFVEEQTRRTSLRMRIDLLNQICQPVPEFEFEKKPYKYEGHHIEQIDARRQEIIHRIALDMPVESVEEDIRYLEATTSYVVNLVSHKYRLPVDLRFWRNHIQSQAKRD